MKTEFDSRMQEIMCKFWDLVFETLTRLEDGALIEEIDHLKWLYSEAQTEAAKYSRPHILDPILRNMKRDIEEIELAM